MTDYQPIKKSGSTFIVASGLPLAQHPSYLSLQHRQTVFFKTIYLLKDTAPGQRGLREFAQWLAAKIATALPFIYRSVFKYPHFSFQDYNYTLKQEKQYEFNLTANKIV